MPERRQEKWLGRRKGGIQYFFDCCVSDATAVGRWRAAEPPPSGDPRTRDCRKRNIGHNQTPLPICGNPKRSHPLGHAHRASRPLIISRTETAISPHPRQLDSVPVPKVPTVGNNFPVTRTVAEFRPVKPLKALHSSKAAPPATSPTAASPPLDQ
jgi:hypothetical protein